ncbi:MAG: hypothetical protein ABR915_10035 [Thermoguttaceae bacterium]|jgi:hypothetical protein
MFGHVYSTSRRFAMALLACFAWQLLGSANPLAAAEKVDPDNCVWTIALTEMFGKNVHVTPRSGNYNLNIYAVIQNGKFSHGLASAQHFNKSGHLVEAADIHRNGDKVTGKLKILMCPDVWIPLDHQPVPVDAEFDGAMTPSVDKMGRDTFALSGTWKAVMHGSNKGPGPDALYQGVLTGSGEPYQTGWERAELSAIMTASPPPGEPSRALIGFTATIADGKILQAGVGVTWFAEARPWREVPLDLTNLRVDGAIVRGKTTVPYRAIDIGCDPRAQADIDLGIYRVQGLVVGKAVISPMLDGKPYAPPFVAAGRGNGTKGAGGAAAPGTPKPVWLESVNLAPWYVPVAGFKPVAPGEHPRLLFRQADVPALRKKAETPDGKAILARLRTLLDGKNGDTLPTVFNPTAPNNHNASPVLPVGAFTTSHGAGYGLLYQVTGDRKYAELARQAVQMCFDGKNDIDNRYCWSRPGTGMRAGAILAGVAYAYDFCYDAWPDDFRKKVALEIQNYNNRVAGDDGASEFRVNLESLSICESYPPGSNHYGAFLGTGVAELGILGDPGTDTAKLAKCLRWAERNLLALLNEGFGDHGFYPEGQQASRVSTNCGGEEFLLALRSAAGRDYITPQPNAQWLTLRWLMEVVPSAQGPIFPHRGVYGGDNFSDERMLSHGGEFATGFGAIDPKLRPGLLWMYDNFVKPAYHDYGAAVYPHRAVLAFVTWPTDVQPANPATVLPKTAADTIHGFFYHRNRWQDADDVVVTNLLDTGPRGFYGLVGRGGKRSENGVYAWGAGIHAQFQSPSGTPVVYETSPDGSSVLSTTTGGALSALAVDLSGASGAPALLVFTGPNCNTGAHDPNGATVTEVTAGGRKFTVVTLQKGEAPKPVADGDRVKVGNQTIRFDGKRLVLGVWNGPPAAK